MAQRQFRNKSDDEVFADWLRWIARAYDEAISQGWRHKMFRLMRCIAQQNADLQSNGGFFLKWAADNYVAASAMALRRELDGQSGTENLLQMLCEMEQRPEVLSRARFRSNWQGDDRAGLYTADTAFDDLRIIRSANGPEADHIDPTLIAEDLALLRSVDVVLDHVQTTIAHRVPMRDAPVPTYGDFHEALEIVGRTFERYYTILTHSVLMTREPVEQFSIYAPFRFAWIADPETFDYKRCDSDGSGTGDKGGT